MNDNSKHHYELESFDRGTRFLTGIIASEDHAEVVGLIRGQLRAFACALTIVIGESEAAAFIRELAEGSPEFTPPVGRLPVVDFVPNGGGEG